MSGTKVVFLKKKGFVVIVIDGNSISRGNVTARVGGTLNVTHILKIDACVLCLVFRFPSFLNLFFLSTGFQLDLLQIIHALLMVP